MTIRREIEFFLDDGYEIVGYSDGHYAFDIWEKKHFFPLEELKYQKFDFILLCASSGEVRAEMKRTLQAYGIPSEKIISPHVLLEKYGAKKQADLFADITRRYRGERSLIFGLSYSVHGIDKRLLKGSFFDCSALSMDLYYNYRLYGWIEKQILTKLETVFWVFPYYYFDYDMSRSKTMYEIGRMFGMWRADDWHNYQCVPGAVEYVENYRMFGRKISQFYHMPKEPKLLTSVYGGTNGTAMLEKVWFADHNETVAENQELFVSFWKKMEAGGGAPILIVPPFYLKGFNSISKAACEKKREKFYKILHEIEAETGTIRVFDYMDRFAERRECFSDVEHLNNAGAAEFTEIINREILAPLFPGIT